ncbi:e3 ubiquitin-protein ligase siah2 [Holotrichia oblita]|uniref:E3 ubiquitin-protein ligase siah2 n=1 Tax=Holotrichia oblita TaxID=644536 RepID=A0ACB9T725_HOLOL|nr:e3 ubiquitin-protein ligase siah2 [Holotrichia oblita]
MAQIINQKRGRDSATVGESSGSNAQSSSLNQLSRLPTPETLTDELAALFEYPDCFEIVLPPIMQCQIGYLVCSSCRQTEIILLWNAEEFRPYSYPCPGASCSWQGQVEKVHP